jgi:hypothetical protein
MKSNDASRITPTPKHYPDRPDVVEHAGVTGRVVYGGEWIRIETEGGAFGAISAATLDRALASWREMVGPEIEEEVAA